METHQRGKRIGRGGLAERVIEEDCSKTHCFLAEFGTYCRLRRGPVVALIEQQVECALDSGKARAEVLIGGDVEKALRRREDLLSPPLGRFQFRLRAGKTSWPTEHPETP